MRCEVAIVIRGANMYVFVWNSLVTLYRGLYAKTTRIKIHKNKKRTMKIKSKHNKTAFK